MTDAEGKRTESGHPQLDCYAVSASDVLVFRQLAGRDDDMKSGSGVASQ